MSGVIRRDAAINQGSRPSLMSNGSPTSGGVKRAVLSNVMGRQICQRMIAAAVNATDVTYRQAFALETPATRFRFKLYNANTAQPLLVKSASIAVTNAYGANAAAQYTPSTALWLASTFGGNGAPTLAAPASARAYFASR